MGVLLYPQSVAWGKHIDGDFCCNSRNHESTTVVVPTSGLTGRIRGPTSLVNVGQLFARNGAKLKFFDGDEYKKPIRGHHCKKGL